MSNSEKASPGVEIELGGKKRVLKFGMRAFMLLEKSTGKNALNGQIFRDPSLTDMVTLTWAGLQHGEDKAKYPTLEEVTDFLTFADFPKLTGAIQTAFSEATPPEAKNGETAEPLPE